MIRYVSNGGPTPCAQNAGRVELDTWGSYWIRMEDGWFRFGACGESSDPGDEDPHAVDPPVF